MKRCIVIAYCAVVSVSVAAGCKKKEAKPPQEVTVVVPPAVPSPMVTRGAKVFEEKCAACHAVNGVGGHTGPDLSKIGTKRDALYLQTQMQDPKAYLPEGKMPSFKDLPKGDKDALVEYLLTLK
jgi:LSD1 subclass zinc finger protein